MRFKISLHPEKERFKLPYNYNHPLASAIYSFVSRGNASLSDFLHDEGFCHDRKAFKLFTFSPLFSSQRKALKDGLLIPQPTFGSRMSFRTSSPIVISTGEMDNGKFHKRYLSPEEPDFNKILEENLRRKYHACYDREPSKEGVSLELRRSPQSKLIDYKGIKVRGWFAHFMAQGNPELIRMGYEAGFGENNSAGFGMVEIVN